MMKITIAAPFRPLLCGGAFLLLLALAPRAPAQGLDLFSTIVDTHTAIPRGTGVFTGFIYPGDPSFYPGDPSFRGGVAGFLATGRRGQLGLYLRSFNAIRPSAPVRIADLNTAIPGGTGNFADFLAAPFSSGLNTLFLGTDSLGVPGVYLGPANPFIPGEPVRPLVASGTAIPGGDGDSFGSFSPCAAIDGSDAAFIGYGANIQGVYSVLNGVLATVADNNTLIPGGEFGFFTNFDRTKPINIRNRIVTFIGQGAAGQGLYLRNLTPGEPVRPLADFLTPVPNSTLFFQFFDSASFDGTTAAFVGGARGPTAESAVQGVYKTIPGNPVLPVADTTTAVPDGIGTFFGFGNVAVDPGAVVFEGFSDDGNDGTRTGLYTDFGGRLRKIVATGDKLGGKTLTDLRCGPYGFGDKNNVVFIAVYSDGSQAIVKAQLGARSCFPIPWCPSHRAARWWPLLCGRAGARYRGI